MSRHHETFEGLCENVDTETQSYIFNQTMFNPYFLPLLGTA